MADGAGKGPLLQVTVIVCIAPRETRECPLALPAGATVADALKACDDGGGALTAPTDSAALATVGIWGRVVGLNTVLQHLDRVEVYRPLTVDPKVARRERFARQGARSTGLFARQRPGGKSGY
ncbi:hypothetical protein CLU85_1896 [Acidovorax sp. 69]|uniref:RnfH family protein n=1 Tax=Acidovorax sp. 69 TaxID=2035202 RepID=UPI000C2496A1|nr:RnfH family protein [Acidovorax sp. 69]PJI97127.1 hypothetical protein CLU85_1896 [Acidovorax sp. 69]